MHIKPEFERCLRWGQVGGICAVCSGVETGSPGKGTYNASPQVWVEIERGVDGNGIELAGERFSRPVEIAEVAVIDTTGAALRENDIRDLDGVLSEA